MGSNLRTISWNPFYPTRGCTPRRQTRASPNLLSKTLGPFGGRARAHRPRGPAGAPGCGEGEAEALPWVRLAAVDVEWVHVLAVGWASPLRGFMREHEHHQTLPFNCIRLPDGKGIVNMSLPIVLAVSD
uniref:ATP-sulfurylase PUA-like domain-containing protein n=1 Tax=Oryza brachyantha TaxID=4533 RepID=J3MH67_ORYBR